jgi:hypothetical protein
LDYLLGNGKPLKSGASLRFGQKYKILRFAPDNYKNATKEQKA